jgi:uridine kinase
VHRAYDPTRTLEHWHYVRTSEMRNIIPYINTSDYIVNSGMPFELPIYRARMIEKFFSWFHKYVDDPLREDAYHRAVRVYHLLQSIIPVLDESLIPPDSVIREFIGGSCYEY